MAPNAGDPRPRGAMPLRYRLRSAVNWANLATPAGLLLGRLAADRPAWRGPRALWVVRGYRLSVPPAPAFTVGNVVLLRSPTPVGGHPVASIGADLLEHEDGHATQYAFCAGILMPVAYLGAAGWSWLRTGDYGSRNIFERRAGLALGGYREAPPRSLLAALTQTRAATRAG